MLIAQGESAKYVCDQMGHSSIQVTFDTYGHLFPNSRGSAAKKLQQAMMTGRKKGFGSSLVAKRENEGKSRSPAKMRDDPYVLVFVEATREEVWLRGVDLNHRPLGYEPNELPDCSTPLSHSSLTRQSGQCRRD